MNRPSACVLINNIRTAMGVGGIDCNQASVKWNNITKQHSSPGLVLSLSFQQLHMTYGNALACNFMWELSPIYVKIQHITDLSDIVIAVWILFQARSVTRPQGFGKAYGSTVNVHCN